MGIIIAIDGDSASGKGTLARALAECLNFAYLDTGLLYRSVASIVLKNNKNLDDAADALWAAKQVDLKGLNPAELRLEPISQGASKVAVYPAVREALLGLQRDFARNPPGEKAGSVLDGRDIGTVVCPDADIKLYVTANAEIRAKRRAKELQDQGIMAIQGQVLADLRQRDDRDRTRTTAPSKAASDAWMIDTSHHNTQQVLDVALDYIKSKKPELASKLAVDSIRQSRN